MKHFSILFSLFLVSNIACSTDEDLFMDKKELLWNDTLPKTVRDSISDKDDNSVPGVYKFAGAEKFLDLNKTVSGVQGGACYGDYFFQGYSTNSRMDVFNLRTGDFICRIQIKAPQKNTRYHANTINFGNQFVDANDKFPVLYVCSGYTKDTSSSEGYVFVYRIIETGGKFELELIQTITLAFGTWTEAILDNEHDAIWIKSNACIYRKYRVPLITEGNCTITPNKGVLEEINIGSQPFTSHNQGHMFYDDRIFLATGVPAWSEKVALVIINTLTGEREIVVDLFDLGLFDASNPLNNYFEPEGVVVYEDEIMICYPKAIYKLIRE